VTIMTEAAVSQPHADDVVDSAPTARWVVEGHSWPPALSDDVIALIAPSVVVSAERCREAG
jgi:hypothetical protein